MKMRLKFLFVLAMAFLFVLSGCGLDNYYYLDMPFSDGHSAIVDTDDEIKNYFSCVTNEQSGTGVNYQYFNSYSDFSFAGTEIYYKIYNSLKAMQDVESAVSSMVSNTTTYTSAAEYLISTKGYRPLKIDYGSLSPLIKCGSSPENRHVYIRLTDYQNDSAYRSGICIGDSPISEWSEEKSLKYQGRNVFPRRNNSSLGFNFSRKDKSNPVPLVDDDDVSYTTGIAEDGSWYVDMYAVSVGRDTSYTESFSQPYFMGAVTIKVSD